MALFSVPFFCYRMMMLSLWCVLLFAFSKKAFRRVCFLPLSKIFSQDTYWIPWHVVVLVLHGRIGFFEDGSRASLFPNTLFFTPQFPSFPLQSEEHLFSPPLAAILILSTETIVFSVMISSSLARKIPFGPYKTRKNSLRQTAPLK